MIFVDHSFSMASRDPEAFRVGKRRGHRWCHMWCNPGEESELHLLAKRIGMRIPRALSHEEAIPVLRRVSRQADLRVVGTTGAAAFDKGAFVVIAACRRDILGRFITDVSESFVIAIDESCGSCAIEGGVVVVAPYWFQFTKQTFPHYDLVPERRSKALHSGAREKSLRDWLTERKAVMAA